MEIEYTTIKNAVISLDFLLKQSKHCTLQKRAKSKNPVPQIPMEIRAEKALEAIYVCSYGKDPIEEEDERLLCTILNAVFPTVGRKEIERIVASLARKVAAGESNFPGQKKVSKEVMQRQLKDLEFLQQKGKSSS